MLVDRKDPKYLKGGEIYFSQYEASVASAVPVHGSGPTTAAIKSGRITPLSDALTALAQDTSEDEEAQEAVRDTLPDKKWVVVEGKFPGWIEDGEIFMTKGQDASSRFPLYEAEEVTDAHLKGQIEVLSPEANEQAVDLISRYMYSRLMDETSPETLEEHGVPQWRGTSAILPVDAMQWLKVTRDALALAADEIEEG